MNTFTENIIYNNILLLFCALFLYNSTIAQNNLIFNSSFEDGNGSAVPRCGAYSDPSGIFGLGLQKGGHDAFNDDISQWKVADQKYCCNPPFAYCASPDWMVGNCSMTYFSPAPPTGTRYIRIGTVNGCANEAVRQFMQSNLQSGKIYTIRMKLMPLNNGQNHIRIHFTQKGPDWDDANNNIKMIDAATFIINTTAGYQIQQWYAVSSQFLGINNVGNIVLIMEEGDFFIDDVELYESCPDEVLIENTVYPNVFSGNPSRFEAAQHIRAGFDVGAITPNGDVVVETGGDVTYKAGEEISLEDGFEVKEGGEFYAYIAPCGWNCPSAFAGFDYNTWCEPGCKTLGLNPTYGVSYLWTSNPPEAINFLSDPTTGNPLFCPSIDFVGTATYTLRVINLCEEISYDDITIDIGNFVNIDISTGTSNEIPLQPGATDPKWVITETPTFSNTNLPAYCSNNPSPWAQSTNANWITPILTSSNDPDDVAPGYWTYTFSFNLNLHPITNYKLIVTEFAADNSGSIALNGVDFVSVSGFTSLQGPFLKTDGFVNGLNTLTVRVYNHEMISGFILSGFIPYDCSSGKTNVVNQQYQNNSTSNETGEISDIKFDSTIILYNNKTQIEHIIIFPNPNHGQFYLLTGNHSAKELIVEIFDFKGAVLYNATCKIQEKLIFNLSYPPGLYFLKAITGNEVLVKKLIIQ